MGNVRSIQNADRADELVAMISSQKDYNHANIISLTESWLHSDCPDAPLSAEGFSLIRSDRVIVKQNGLLKRGGGIAVYINKTWCKDSHATVKKQICNADIELMGVVLRPYYLPREFSCVVLLTVYCPPDGNVTSARDTIFSTVASFQTHYPNSLILVNGDFNQVKMAGLMSDFTQYVTCKTRGENTLDLLYANVRNAYSCTPLPPVCGSDHTMVRLTPKYIPVVKRIPATTREVQCWSEEVEERLRFELETTDWDFFFREHGEDVDGLCQVITDYISFCERVCVPTKRVRCFSNNKPWMTKEIINLLKKKKDLFHAGDQEGVKRVVEEVKVAKALAKECYKAKLENCLQENNTRQVWGGYRKITGYGSANTSVPGSVELANEMNCFFNRFDGAGASNLVPGDPGDRPATPPPLTLTAGQVRRQLSKINTRKAAGPDNINSRVLKVGAEQLAAPLTHLFNLSLTTGRVPKLWKSSCIVPVPKKGRPSVLNDYRPVALTSQVMKVFERLVLNHLKPTVSEHLDPLQFAYQAGIGVDDAITYLHNRALNHLEEQGCTVRVMFFDFSSAFNTIQPFLLAEKLSRMGVDNSLVAWITDYLSERPQFVRLQDCRSEVLLSNTGAPQGTVLSPFLFTLYTSDFRYDSKSCHLQKFSDDTVVVSRIYQDNTEEHEAVVCDFVRWSEANHLRLNASKTKEMVVDFRTTKRVPPVPLTIKGEVVELVDKYKFLGVHLNSSLDWSDNAEAIHSKGKSRLFFLRRLRSFGVCNRMLQMFYQSVMASVLFFGITCWGGNNRESDTFNLNRLVKKASAIVGSPLLGVEAVAKERTARKLDTIIDNPSHPLHQEITLCWSKRGNDRFIYPTQSHARLSKSFVPTALRQYNETHNGRLARTR